MEMPEFLDTKEGEHIDMTAILNELQNMVDNYLILNNDIKVLEEKLKEKKECFNKISMEDIPMFLLQHNLSEIRLASGQKVIVKEDISVTVKDQEKFFKFLENRNEADIIKTNFLFDKMNKDKYNTLFNFLNEQSYLYTVKKDVHAQTKKKYFKELLGIGKEDYEDGIKTGKYLKVSTVIDFTNIYNYFKTKIK